jgi:hypothetical protein
MTHFWRILFFIVLPAAILATLPPTFGRMIGGPVGEAGGWIVWASCVLGNIIAYPMLNQAVAKAVADRDRTTDPK